MGARSRPADAGADRARRLLSEAGRELREARRDRGLSTRAVGHSAGISSSSVSRIERGLVPHVSVLDLARLHAAVGLDLSLKSYPGGQPVRDRAQLALLAAFRAQLHPSVVWRSEVPVGPPGDRRAWDAVIRAKGTGRFGVEAETSPRDVQALERRLALKRRDGDVDGVILVLSNTRQTRAFLLAGGDPLLAEFPVPGDRAIALLRGGQDPGGSAIIVLAGAFARASRRGSGGDARRGSGGDAGRDAGRDGVAVAAPTSHD